jgi:ABC-2 type transport system permease protein
MTRLLWAELNRLRSRRFTLIALLAVFLALAAFQLVVNDQVTPPSAAEQARNQAQYEQAHRDWVANHQTYEQQCQQTNDPAECVIPEPQLSDFGGARSFREVAATSLTLAVYLAGLVTYLVAGSYIGAEYSTGSIANWLTFIPRRGQVFTAKLVVVVAFSALTSALASALVLAAAAGLVRVHDGQVSGLTRLAQTGGRGAAVAVALAAVGFCVGLISRHTAAAIGVLLGYLFIWFVRSGLLGELSFAQRLTPWTPEANLQAIVENGHTYAVPIRRLAAEGEVVDTVERTISLTHGSVYWAVLLVVVIVGSLLVFRRRDVT